MWKDDAIDEFLPKLFTPLINNINGAYREIILIAEFDKGYVGVSGIYYDEKGLRRGVPNFFSISEDIKRDANLFRDEFTKHNENFVAVKLVLDADDNFESEFEYDKPGRWDLSNATQFPKQK